MFSILTVALLTIAFSSGVSIQHHHAWADTVVGTIPVGRSPAYIAFDSANGNLYVTNFNGNTVTVIATTLVLSGAPVPEFPFIVPILLISFASVIVFYSIRIRKNTTYLSIKSLGTKWA